LAAAVPVCAATGAGAGTSAAGAGGDAEGGGFLNKYSAIVPPLPDPQDGLIGCGGAADGPSDAT
jgi:hypothetical protein